MLTFSPREAFCTYADGKVTFDTNHLSMYMIGFESPSGGSGEEFPILIVAVIIVGAVAGVGLVFFLNSRKKA